MVLQIEARDPVSRYIQGLKKQSLAPDSSYSCAAAVGSAKGSGMIELVLTVCALAQPNTCVDEHMLFDSDNTLRQCMMSAPPFIAKWGTEHPEWTVQRWKCQYPKRDEKDT